MLSIIAPLDYERWAVLVNPLLVPGGQHGESGPSPRQAEQLGQVNASLSSTSSRAGEGLREPVSRSTGLRQETQKREPAPPLNGPHPTDFNWFFLLPNGSRGLMQDLSAPVSRIVAGLYDHPKTTRGATVSVSG